MDHDHLSNLLIALAATMTTTTERWVGFKSEVVATRR